MPASAYTPAVITPLPAERITHCLGRYLIDLPKGFELQTGGWGDIELYYGLDKNFKRVYASVKNERYTPEQFINATKARHDELQKTINDETKKPMLLNVERVAAHMPSGEHWTYQGKDLGRAQVTQGEAMPAFPLAYTRDNGAREWKWVL